MTFEEVIIGLIECFLAQELFRIIVLVMLLYVWFDDAEGEVWRLG